jgi:hypothetical protein
LPRQGYRAALATVKSKNWIAPLNSSQAEETNLTRLLS